MNNNPTPCGALFDVMKKHASISYKELAGLILSNRPLSDAAAPISRVGDRTGFRASSCMRRRDRCRSVVSAITAWLRFASWRAFVLAPIVPCGAAMCLLCFATKGFPK